MTTTTQKTTTATTIWGSVAKICMRVYTAMISCSRDPVHIWTVRWDTHTHKSRELRNTVSLCKHCVCEMFVLCLLFVVWIFWVSAYKVHKIFSRSKRRQKSALHPVGLITENCHTYFFLSVILNYEKLSIAPSISSYEKTSTWQFPLVLLLIYTRIINKMKATHSCSSKSPWF